mgnify:CR=1 FL=1
MPDYLNHRVQRLGYKSYSAYLQSPQWKLFRDRVKASACYSCGRHNVILQVHHINYDRLGDERPDDVVTLCNSCHEAIHDIVRDGISLETAHETYKAPVRERKPTLHKPRQEWVSWFKLLNKSKHQTLYELKGFLVEEGLSTGENATEKAYKIGLVRNQDGREQWCLRKYIRIMQTAKKRAKRTLKNNGIGA